MSYALRFVIDGQPVGKERHRYSRLTGRHYTPKKTENYEKYVGTVALKALWDLPDNQRVQWPTDRQVFMDVYIYHLNGKKPDSCNVVTAIQDGLSGVLWENDRHVLSRVYEEIWPDENPRVAVVIGFTGYKPGKNGLEWCGYK